MCTTHARTNQNYEFWNLISNIIVDKPVVVPMKWQ
jgi:hypothetical protein